MKYSISIRQPDLVLKKADEIRLNYCDVNALYDKMELFPDKTFTIIIPKDTEIDWQELRGFHGKGHMIIGIEDLDLAEKCDQYNIDFFWVYPVTSFYELYGLMKLHIKEVILGAPLYFDVAAVKKIYPQLRIRLRANVCHDNVFPLENGLRGTYIRPEDVELYEDYVDILYFEAEGLSQERALLEIYKENKTWPGNLNILLTNLNCDVDNRGIPDQFGPARLQCRQNCMRTGKCNFCTTAFHFVNAINKIAHPEV